MSNHAKCAATGASSPNHSAPKIERAGLAWLQVCADPCPRALMRALDQITRRGSAPQAIAFARGSRLSLIEITLEIFPPREADLLLHRIRAMPTVRGARLRRTALLPLLVVS